jgi:hypothetical protein
MKNKILVSVLCLFSIASFAQQTIKGKIVDKESQFPLPGVTVMVTTVDPVIGAVTDIDGNYRLKNVPIGRHSVRVSYIGYAQQELVTVVTSGKEVILNISIEESTEMLAAVQIVAGSDHKVNNDMALVSARVFSVEETERYAGSRGDPARMVSNFAGVGGADDSRNDIVIRGNSPLGVVYRVEGVDIPNPNHFAISGSSGGPTSMLNNKLMANSDFFTGAFPAEYGNSTSGVFDLKLRAGNNEKREWTAQFGVLGAELMAEGPFKKGKSASYLLMYKYSTLGMFQAAGIDVGTNALPHYQDLSFKMNFPLKRGGNLALWGIGGNSGIDILISDQKDTSEIDLYGQNDRDQYFSSGMAIGGLTYTKPLNEKTFIKTTLSGSYERQSTKHDLIYRHVDAANGEFIQDSILANYMGYQFNTTKYTSSTYLNKKFGKKNVLKIGYNADYYTADLSDSITENDTVPGVYRTRWNSNESFVLIQSYIQWKHKFSDDFIFTAGLHNQSFTLSNSHSWAQPRAGLKWTMNDKNSLSLGVGRHSQTLPIYTYFYQLEGNTEAHNKGMDYMKSNHAVLGYSRKISKNLSAKVETYYQDLSNIPVEIKPSSFSLINQGSGFSRFFPDSLENSGTGYNYGIEFTLEKYYSSNWHMLLTGAVYNSRYEGSDEVDRNTSFNGGYAVNILGGREFKLNEKSTLSLGAKVTLAGGKRYGKVNDSASIAQQEIIYLDDGYNEQQFADYFRADFKLSYKYNAKKVTHEFSLDIVNLLGTKNLLNLTYAPVPGDPDAGAIRKNYQLGFLPIFYYRLDF